MKMTDNKSEERVIKTLDDCKNDEEKIMYHYQRAQGSIQDIARVYHRSVDEVLHILGLDDMTEVATQGDLIDQSEAGPEVRVNPNGNPAKAHYTTD
jgi:hypothetical protein